jgi:uncharacterized protein involved in exopolysaccharide biosynthesis
MSEQPIPFANTGSDDEIDLRELVGILWAEKWLIIAATSVAAIASVAYALLATEIFRAEAVLVPAEARQSASPLLNQLGGAAALIGINVGTQSGSAVDNAIAIMRSREFIVKFISEHDVLVPLFAGSWDRTNGTSVDRSIFDPETNEWRQENGAPSDLMAYRAFNEILDISQDPANGIVRVGIEWHDPELASQWVNKLVEDINRDIKEADVQEANDAIRYLQEQLQTTQLVDMQRVFYQLIESQTRVTMLADVREEYVFQVIDSAVVPDQRIAPRRPLIAVAGTLAGVVVGLLLVFFIRVLRPRTIPTTN